MHKLVNRIVNRMANEVRRREAIRRSDEIHQQQVAGIRRSAVEFEKASAQEVAQRTKLDHSPDSSQWGDR